MTTSTRKRGRQPRIPKECGECGRTIRTAGSARYPERLMPHTDTKGFPCGGGGKQDTPEAGRDGHNPRSVCDVCKRSIALTGNKRDPDALMPHVNKQGFPCRGARRKPTIMTGDLERL